MLFDNLGPEWRSPAVIEALRCMAIEGVAERGAIFTRPEVVDVILDLAGYTSDRPLHRLRLLEPSFGDGEFLIAAVKRLLAAYKASVPNVGAAEADLSNAVCAVELNPDSYARTESRLIALLQEAGIILHDARAICSSWLICDDFLLCRLEGCFDFVVGNPPYVRQERIPNALLSEYRARFSTLYDRADLYVPFYERALDFLVDDGVLGFICANRWLKNKYGGPLRLKIQKSFHLTHFIDMESVDSFHTDVIAYPAITIVRRPFNKASSLPATTRVASASALSDLSLGALAKALSAPENFPEWVDEVILDGKTGDPWLLNDVSRLKLLRDIESTFPTLEEVGCKVGIGVATGCDRVFIDDYDALPVEPECKLQLAMARDLVDGKLQWGGKGVLNPFESDGSLVSLEKYPQFAAYLDKHRDAISARHVASRSGSGWYRTIDRIYPDLVIREKLLVPDIKGKATFVFDSGLYYPHHNLYYITSDDWNLRALQTVLRSSISIFTVATYCTKMAGGFLRFQAQYLRRIRIPKWNNVSEILRKQLIEASEHHDQAVIDAPVFELYGLSAMQAAYVAKIANDAQVTTSNKKLIQ